MKKLFLTLALTLTLMAANAQAIDTGPTKYNFDKTHTNVVWFANHFGFSHPFGYFSEVEGYFAVDQNHPELSKIDVTIKTASLGTPFPKFTEHLKSKDFFDVTKFPDAKFVSTKVDVTGKDTANVIGDLTLHGVTKPVVLEVKLNNIGDHPMSKKPYIGFSATSIIKRSDFGISYGLPGVGDDVRLVIEVEGEKAEDAASKK